MRLVRALFMTGIVLASLLALAFLLPWLKEGFDREELPLFLGITAGLVAAAIVWWMLNRRALGALFALGLGVLAVPLAAYLAVSSKVLVNDWQGRRLAREARVVSIREEPISWRGFDGPVGIRLEIELEHGIGRDGNLFPPKLVMAADPRPAYRDYFFGPLDHGIDEYLGPPAFEVGSEPPRDVLARPGRARLAFELFPSTLTRREGEAVCLTQRAAIGRSAALGVGSDLGAAWFFAAPGGLIVDLGAPLTEGLRRSSRLQGNREEWRKMMGRLEPAALPAAGWRPCLPARHVAETCYCPP